MATALRAQAAFQAATNPLHRNSRMSRRAPMVMAAGTGSNDTGTALPPAAPALLSRRQLQAAALAAVLATQPQAAQAVGFKKELKKKTIPLEDYVELSGEPRLRYYDLTEGNGAEVKAGSRVVVHFESKYRGLTVLSTRTARTLGGNRTVAEPFEFIVGQPLQGDGSLQYVESAGGLFAGGGGPKPPPALSSAVVGMRVGGTRSVLVPAELGYGSRGEQEIPPNCESFELRVELLSLV